MESATRRRFPPLGILAWTLAVSHAATAQDSRPASAATPQAPAHAQWSGDGPDLTARVPGMEQEIPFPMRGQWTQLYENGGLTAVFQVLLSGSSDLRLHGDAEHYLRCLHGEPTPDLLRRLLAAPAEARSESSRRTTDRLVAMQYCVDQGPEDLRKLVVAIAEGTTKNHDSATRRAAQELLTTTSPGADSRSSPVLLLERLPADAGLYLCIDESRLPRLRNIARSFARFMRVFQDEAIRRAGGRLGASTLAYGTMQADASRFFVPLVFGHLGGVRLHAAALAIPLLEAPAGFFGQADTVLVCSAEYDREKFVEHVTELASSGARPRLPVSGTGPVRLDVRLPASRGAASVLQIELDERRIELGTERTGTPLGKAGAGNLLTHWERVLPALDAFRVHARIADVGVLDAGFAQDASGVHLEVVLECPDEARAQQWLELARERMAGLSERNPESAGVLLNPLVLARIALHEFGEPKLSRTGRHLRAVVTRSGTLDDLLAQLVEDFASFASNLGEKR